MCVKTNINIPNIAFISYFVKEVFLNMMNKGINLDRHFLMFNLQTATTSINSLQVTRETPCWIPSDKNVSLTFSWLILSSQTGT